VIKVKEKILMKIDVNALTSSSGSMGVFLAEYGIFLTNKRTLKSYDLKDEVRKQLNYNISKFGQNERSGSDPPFLPPRTN
jgi:hypothetical protein